MCILLVFISEVSGFSSLRQNYALSQRQARIFTSADIRMLRSVVPLHSSPDGANKPLMDGENMNYRSDHAPYSAEWAAERGMEPGHGGVWPGNPDAEKFKVTVISKKTNETFVTEVAKDRYIYYAFEEKRQDLPIVNARRMCRQGCCTICAAKIIDGKVKMDAPLGLLKELREQNYGLLCCSTPRSDLTVVLQDEDEMYVRQWAEGFEGGGTEWGGFFLDED